jgi:hypothetical protein
MIEQVEWRSKVVLPPHLEVFFGFREARLTICLIQKICEN